MSLNTEDYPHTSWAVIECVPSETGADAVKRAFGLFDTEQDALDALAEMRDDNPDTGDSWTTVPVHMDY